MKPVLLVMAAGMGSRYGGLKQIDPIGPNGEVIIDYSLYDAKIAGFEDVYFIIKKEIEDDFKKVINRGAGKHLNVHYLYQEIGKIPEGFTVPDSRKKPWGTGHAILMAKGAIDVPFAVINADDYYGPDAFKILYDYLSDIPSKEARSNGVKRFCMVGYRLENTLTANGSVARGVCEEDAAGHLTGITERTKIQLNNDRIQYSEDDGKTWIDISAGTLVSMNMFGFSPAILEELDKRFPAALMKILATNPDKGEFFIPAIVSELINEGIATVKVLPSCDKWYGVTYKEDKPDVMQAMKEKIAMGQYPEKLW